MAEGVHCGTFSLNKSHFGVFFGNMNQRPLKVKIPKLSTSKNLSKRKIKDADKEHLQKHYLS